MDSLSNLAFKISNFLSHGYIGPAGGSAGGKVKSVIAGSGAYLSNDSCGGKGFRP